MSKPLHNNYVDFEVQGDYGLFSNPLTRAGGERSTLLVPTYEALKGIISSVMWKPTIVWHIKSCRVMNQIRTCRKGVRPIKYGGGNDLAYYTYLCNPRYQVRAYFEWNDNRPELESDRNENKYHNIAKRMVQRGGRRSIWIGTSECYGYVSPCVFGEGEGFYDPKEGKHAEISFGMTYHGITYADEAVLEEDKGQMTVRFWQPVMRDGIIEFVQPEEIPSDMKRHIREMKIKPFGVKNNNFTGLEEFRTEGDEINGLG